MQTLFNRFSSSAKKALMQARIYAAGSGHREIRTGHLLVGLIRAADPLTRSITDGLDQEALEKAVAARYTDAEEGFVNANQLSGNLRSILDEAVRLASDSDVRNPEEMHIWAALVKTESASAAELLSSFGKTMPQIQDVLDQYVKEQAEKAKMEQDTQESPEHAEEKKKPQSQPGSQTPKPPVASKPEPRRQTVLDMYARDLTKAAADGELEPLIGRDSEVSSIIQILCKKIKNNPMLLGDPGVGKSSLAEGLAQRIHEGSVPDILKNARILSLDLTRLVAGSRFRGDFEERITGVLKEVEKESNIILFIDEIHTLIGSGGNEGALDAANILKPALARGQIRVIGATTYKEYRKYIEKDAALTRRFQRIDVREPNPEDTLIILNGLRKRYEDFHHVKISDSALKSAVSLSARYVTERFMPDKAIDLLDETAAMAKLYRPASDENMITIDEADVARVISQWTGVPVTQITKHNQGDVIDLENRLSQRIFGQSDAVSTVSRALRRAHAGLTDPDRPLGVFMMLGPSGVGKTELCKALSTCLFGSRDALVRIDMSEYSEKSSVAKLIGSPPGYVGHGDGGQLTDAVMKRPYSIILFDEIEKAHPVVFNLLLQLLDDGILTDSMGRKVNFKNTIIFMTSNAGVTFDMDKRVGFSKSAESNVNENRRKMILDKTKQVFRPEFLGRIDELIVMNSLTLESGCKIADYQLSRVADRLANRGVALHWNGDVCTFIARLGLDPMSGARNLKRMITGMVEDPLCDLILSEQVRGDAYLSIKNEELQISACAPEESVSENAALVQ